MVLGITNGAEGRTLEPARISTVDFESTASTDFATSALKGYRKRCGLYLSMAAMQAAACLRHAKCRKKQRPACSGRLRSHFPLRLPGKITPASTSFPFLPLPLPLPSSIAPVLPPSAKRRPAPCSTLSVYLRQTKET